MNGPEREMLQLQRARLARGRPRRLSGRRGVTDVPLELLIIIIILAIVIPIIVAALIEYTTAQTALSVQQQASNVRDVAVQVYDDGINTTLLVTLDLPGSGHVQAGASIWLRGGVVNWYGATKIYYAVGTASPGNLLVDNGASNVLIGNITCRYPVVNWAQSCSTQVFSIASGVQTQIALTKISPGGFFMWGGAMLPDPTNLTAGFVEVHEVYP